MARDEVVLDLEQLAGEEREHRPAGGRSHSVRLFAEVIDGLELRADDVIVARPESGPWTLATPEYLVLLTRDIAALAGRGRPRALRPSDVSSDLLDQAGLLASIASATETPFAALEEFFARIGLPIDAPYPP